MNKLFDAVRNFAVTITRHEKRVKAKAVIAQDLVRSRTLGKKIDGRRVIGSRRGELLDWSCIHSQRCFPLVFSSFILSLALLTLRRRLRVCNGISSHSIPSSCLWRCVEWLVILASLYRSLAYSLYGE